MRKNKTNFAGKSGVGSLLIIALFYALGSCSPQKKYLSKPLDMPAEAKGYPDQVDRRQGKDYTYRSGHFMWDRRKEEYAFIPGEWVAQKKGYRWDPGEWQKSRKGFWYRRARWVKVKGEQPQPRLE